MDIDGYESFATSKSKSEKLFWGSIILVGLGTGTYFATYSILDNLETPTAVSIAETFKTELELPEIVICSSRLFDRQRLIDRNLSKSLIQALYFTFVRDSYTGIYSENSVEFPSANITPVDIDLELVAHLNAKYTYGDKLESFLLDTGVSCSSLLLSCSIGWRSLRCCDQSKSIISPMYNKCYVLSNGSTAPWPQEWPGYQAGYSLIVNTTDDVIDVHASVTPGVFIEISRSYTMTSDDYLAAAPGSTMYVELSMVQTTHVQPCYEQAVAGAYEDRLCTLYQLGDAFQQICGCSLIGLKAEPITVESNTSRSNISFCLPSRMKSCISGDRYEQISSLARSLSALRCTKSVCVEWRYDKTVTYAEANVGRLSAILGINPSETTSLAHIFVFYSSLSFMQIDEFDTMTFDSLVSALGGNYGLFIGGSAITVVQVLVFVAVQAMKLWKRKCGGKIGSLNVASAMEGNK